MASRHEQIGQSAGDQQTVGVLVEPAIAHLSEAEHPLDDPDRMFDPGPDLRLGPIFRPLNLIHDTAVAVAAIGEIPGFWRVPPDHRPLAAISLIAPHPGLLPMQQIRQHRAVGGIGRGGGHRMDPAWYGCRRQDEPSCRSTTGCPSWSDASPDHAPSWRSWSKKA